MTFKILIGVGLFVALMVGCSSGIFVQPKVGDIEGEYDIEYAETIVLAGSNIKVTFEGEIHDSRCPSNAYCIWPGVAIVPLTIISDSDTIKIVVATTVDGHSSPPEFVDTLGLRFELLNLSPYPDGQPMVDSEYVATIKVSTSPGQEYTPAIIISNAGQTYIEQFAYDIDSVRIEGDRMSLWVNYGGGCEQHYFQLYMSPAAFAESEPVQATFYLRHFGEQDFCLAWIHRKLEFDLGPVAKLYHESYGGAGGIVRVNFVNCASNGISPAVCKAGWNGTYWVADLLD